MVMPDLLFVFAKRWKLILVITFLSVAIALLFALLSPKKYLSVATALPANSVTADKARIFNSNIEALYSDFGTPDELDRIEGTAALDTIFIAASRELQLPEHYSMATSGEGPFEAAMRLKRNSRINRSSYGELKVKVWDTDRNLAATLANFLMQKLQELHQHLQNQNNISVLGKIKEEYASKQKEYMQLADSLNKPIDTPSVSFASAKKEIIKTKMIVLAEQVQQYEKMIGEYQLTANANLPVLLVVENARPSLLPDKPKILSTVLFTFFGALLFSWLLALFIENGKSLE
jgi:uncharacterized protein involved in exopolysaccharide biosynthesis